MYAYLIDYIDLRVTVKLLSHLLAVYLVHMTHQVPTGCLNSISPACGEHNVELAGVCEALLCRAMKHIGIVLMYTFLLLEAAVLLTQQQPNCTLLAFLLATAYFILI